MIIIITNMKISETLVSKQKVVRKTLDLFFGFIRLNGGLSRNLYFKFCSYIRGIRRKTLLNRFRKSLVITDQLIMRNILLVPRS